MSVTLTTELISMRKATGTIGDGVTTTFQIVHSVMSQDIVVSVRKTYAPKTIETPAITMIDDNTIDITFPTPPAQDGCTVTVIG